MGSIRVRSGAVVGVLVAGALAAGSLNAAPPADASCVSAFGLDSGTGCTSNRTSIAIAIGDGATANSSQNYLGISFAYGTNAHARAGNGLLNFSAAIGDNSNTEGYISTLSVSVQFGAGTAATLGFANLAIGVSRSDSPNSAASSGVGNIVAQFGPGSIANIGFLSLALSTSPGVTNTGGLGNIGLNFSRDPGSSVTTSGNLAIAADIGGKGNTVSAGPGPFAIAASLFQTGKTVTKAGPGVNINGLVIGGAASVSRGAAIRPSPKASAQTHGAKKTVGTTADGNTKRVRN